jgi:hypothetical protein
MTYDEFWEQVEATGFNPDPEWLRQSIIEMERRHSGAINCTGAPVTPAQSHAGATP